VKANILFAIAVVVVLLTAIALRRYMIFKRVKEYTGGNVPETLDLGAVFLGWSTDKGMLKPVRGVIFPTADALVFISSEICRKTVEMPWRRLNGWSLAGEFRGRPLHRKMVTFSLSGDIGNPVDLLFTLPRPEFWTSLVNVALKSEKKD
jgi:hypothetical protein